MRRLLNLLLHGFYGKIGDIVLEENDLTRRGRIVGFEDHQYFNCVLVLWENSCQINTVCSKSLILENILLNK